MDNYRGIKVEQGEDSLKLSVAGLERTFSLKDGCLRTTGMTFEGRTLAVEHCGEQDFNIIGLWVATEEHPYSVVEITSRLVDASYLEGEHVDVMIRMADPFRDTEYRRIYTMYPGIPAMGVRTEFKSAVMAQGLWTPRLKLEGPMRRWETESCQDWFVLPEAENEILSVEFFGRSDVDNIRVTEHHAKEGAVRGNLLIGKSFAILQEAPPSSERRDFEPYDFVIDGAQIRSCTCGITQTETMTDVFIETQRHVFIALGDGDAQTAVKHYLKHRFPLDKRRGGAVVVNPWGCGQLYELMSTDFLKAEGKAAAAAGADYYQIDDGWEAGKALSNLTRYSQHITPKFWDVAECLGGSLADVCESFKDSGIRPGLWYAPSSNCDYKDWNEGLNLILNMYRTYGIDLFKIDAVLARTMRAETNLKAMLEQARRMTDGAVYFNLDTTAGQRPGYFQFQEYGNTFLENRYLSHVWGVGYHPEKVLHSLWALSRYIRTQTLQIEIPNPEELIDGFVEAHTENCSPLVYSADYMAAISLFAAPLLWFAPSRASTAFLDVIRRSNDIHHQIWDDLYDCTVYPLAEEPSGKAFTGFQAHNARTGHGFLLFFREAASACVTCQVALMAPVAGGLKQLIGAEDAAITADGTHVTLPCTASFALWAY